MKTRIEFSDFGLIALVETDPHVLQIVGGGNEAIPLIFGDETIELSLCFHAKPRRSKPYIFKERVAGNQDREKDHAHQYGSKFELHRAITSRKA